MSCWRRVVRWKVKRLFYRSSRDDVAAGVRDMVVLGIETSCDDTGVGVVSSSGRVMGEALHSQLPVHLKTGGVVPSVASGLHAQHLQLMTQTALTNANLTMADISAIAVTVGPGLAPCLNAGLEFTKQLAHSECKPVIPVHHMEAHALTARLFSRVPFPYLILLVSGGHCLLLVAERTGSFQRLGCSLDRSPGELLDKVARMMQLHTHPEVSSLSGGAAIEQLAARGDPNRFNLPLMMSSRRDCMFSFTGLRTAVERIISGTSDAPFLYCDDLAASVQNAVCHHLTTRTHRAICFTRTQWPSIEHLVVSGGVASNKFLRSQLDHLCCDHGLQLVCPPPKYCTDNGVMIAWTAVEHLNTPGNVLQSLVTDHESLRYHPRWPLGEDMSSKVAAANIKLTKQRTTPITQIEN